MDGIALNVKNPALCHAPPFASSRYHELPHLAKSYLTSLDNLILNYRVQVNEVGAEPRYPDDKTSIVFRMKLGIPESIGAHYVELNMVSAHVHISPYHG